MENENKVVNMESVGMPKLNTRNISQVRQVPYWNIDSKFVLTGEEFLKLQNHFNIFTDPVKVMSDVFSRSLNDGTINVKYIDDNNNEFTKEEVTSYINSQSVNKPAQESVQPLV